MKQRDDLAVVDAQVKELGKNATEWRTSTEDGRRHAVLLKKRNRMENQIKTGEVVLEGVLSHPLRSTSLQYLRRVLLGINAIQ